MAESSESVLRSFPFRLPEQREVEVLIVRLGDGRIVARTRDELEPDSAAPRRPFPEER